MAPSSRIIGFPSWDAVISAKEGCGWGQGVCHCDAIGCLWSVLHPYLFWVLTRDIGDRSDIRDPDIRNNLVSGGPPTKGHPMTACSLISTNVYVASTLIARANCHILGRRYEPVSQMDEKLCPARSYVESYWPCRRACASVLLGAQSYLDSNHESSTESYGTAHLVCEDSSQAPA